MFMPAINVTQWTGRSFLQWSGVFFPLTTWPSCGRKKKRLNKSLIQEQPPVSVNLAHFWKEDGFKY